MDLPAIRAALAAALDGLDGWQVSPYPLSNPTAPCIEIGRRDPLELHRSMRAGTKSIGVVIRALVAFSADIGAQRKLDTLLPEVKPLVEADKKLGGLIDDLHVSEVSGDQVYERGGSQYIGCEWSVQILTSN